MKALALSAGVLLIGQAITTDYDKLSQLRVDSSTSISMETTRSFERDGEPVEGRGGSGANSSNELRKVVFVDEYLEREDGQPTLMRRSFDTVSSTGAMSIGDNESEMNRESPFEGAVIEIAMDDGEAEVVVVEGAIPDDELLEGHLPTLALDALLPDGEVEVDDSWDIESDAVIRALGFDVQAALFPRPEPSDEQSGEGRRGRGRGGRGDSSAQMFALGDWEGTATLTSLDEEYEGITCASIEIEIECEGELPEPEFGGRGGRRGGGGFEFTAASAVVLASEFEIEAEGRLLYSIEDRRPVFFELEGKLSSESEIERETQRGSFRITSTGHGTFTQTVSISAEESE